MYSAEHPAMNGPHAYWSDAVELPGANQMRFVRQLMTARPLLDRVPDQSLILENTYPAAERIQATRGRDYAFVYSAAGRPFTLRAGVLPGAKLTAYWVDPRQGDVKPAGTFANRGQLRFTPPTTGYGYDWVLVIDEAATYPAPAIR